MTGIRNPARCLSIPGWQLARKDGFSCVIKERSLCCFVKTVLGGYAVDQLIDKFKSKVEGFGLWLSHDDSL